MQDREKLEAYIKAKRWEAADEWVRNELCFVQGRVISRSICCHVFALLLTLVFSLFTWGFLFPSAENIEITRFPFATVSKDVFVWLCGLLPETVPAPKAFAVAGLLSLPFFVFLILTFATRGVRAKKYIKKGRISPSLETSIGQLDKAYSRYNHGHFDILLWYLLISVIVGVIMAAVAAPSSDKVIRYLFVGAMCAALYGVCFWGVCYVIDRFYDIKSAPVFNPYYYYDYIRMANGTYVYESREETYTGPSIYSDDFETDDERIARIVRDVEDDLSGGGFGNY